MYDLMYTVYKYTSDLLKSFTTKVTYKDIRVFPRVFPPVSYEVVLFVERLWTIITFPFLFTMYDYV